MNQDRRRSQNLSAIALLLLAILLVAQVSDSAAAQDGGRTGGVEMIVRAGFGGLSVRDSIGGWVPFRIELRNQGEPISGRLVVQVEVGASSPQGIDFVREVHLPTGSSQLHEIPVFLRSSQGQPVVRLTTRRGSDETVITETRVPVERQRSFMSERLEIAVVDSDSTALNDITSTEIARPSGRSPFKKAGSRVDDDDEADDGFAAPPVGAQSRSGRQRGRFFGQFRVTAQPVVISSEELPRDFVSYDTVGALVIGDAPLSQIAPEQARALRLWVASGGLLVLTGGSDFGGLRAAGLGDLMPVEAEGLTALPALTELTDVYGAFDVSDSSLVMSGRMRNDARMLVGKTVPIAAEMEFGKGLVRYVAINPKLNPYRGWGGAKDLWSDLLLPAAEAERHRYNALLSGWGRGNQGIESYLFKLAAISPPSANYFLLFLLAYIVVVGPLNYIVLRWFRKLDLAWVTIPSVVIVFTAVSVAVAQITRGSDSIASDVAIIELYQSKGIARSLGGLLIMPSSKGTHEIAFNGRDTYVADFNRSASDPMEVERGPKGPLLRVQMNKWTSRSFQTHTITEDVPLLVDVDLSTPGSAAVRNLTEFQIRKAVVIAGSGASEVFDLDPGETRQVTVSALPGEPFADWYRAWLADHSEEHELFQDLSSALEGGVVRERNFFAAPSMAGAGKLLRQPLLVGFIDSTPLAFDFRGSQKRRSKGFYVVHLQ